MTRFGETYAAIAAHPGKLEKIALLAEYFRSLDDANGNQRVVLFALLRRH